MNQQQMTMEMIKFNKSVLDNTFNAISTIQDQSEKIFTTFMDKANWLPDDGKKAINDWIAAYKRGRTDFKMATDAKYEKVANYFMKQTDTGTSGMKM
jgi:hypothetical protein